MITVHAPYEERGRTTVLDPNFRNDTPKRSFEMFLMHENLARAHLNELHAEARQAAVASRLNRARRLQRRADELALRARRANARVN